MSCNFGFSFILPGFTQTIIWDEQFKELPTGWDMEGNWAVDNNELMLYYYPIIENYDFSALSPEFNISTNGGELTVSQFVDVYLSYVTDETVEISVLHNGSEDILWSYALSEGSWGSYGGDDISFDLADYAGETIRIKFRSFGATTGALWGWHIYSTHMVSTFDHELAAGSLTGPKNIDLNTSGTWQVEVENKGLETENDFLLKVFSYKETDPIALVECNQTLNPGDTETIDFDWSTDMIQNTILYAVIVSETDEYAMNNRSKDHFVRVEPESEYKVLLWDNDNDIPTIFNPLTNTLEQSSESLENYLYNAGISYDYFRNLPDNLSQYDVIISTMGTYCLS